MIIPPTGIRVLVATKPVDFRKGMDGLAAYVEEQLQADPFSGVVYVFRAKRADRVKLLFWDQTGLVLVTKRLEGSPASGRGSSAAALSPRYSKTGRKASCPESALGPLGGTGLVARAYAPRAGAAGDAMILVTG